MYLLVSFRSPWTNRRWTTLQEVTWTTYGVVWVRDLTYWWAWCEAIRIVGRFYAAAAMSKLAAWSTALATKWATAVTA